MGTHCPPFLADLFPHSHETDFIQGLLKKNGSFNFTFRYIDGVLSLNNYIFGNFVDCIFPIVVEIKDVTATDKSGTYPWSYVTQIFHKGQPSHVCDRKMFEVMTSA
jgi:hypothetical protein